MSGAEEIDVVLVALGAISVLSIGYYLIIASRRGGHFSPDSFFIGFNSVALLGVYISVDLTQDLHVKYIYIVNGGFLIFTWAATVFRLIGVRSMPRTGGTIRVAELSANLWLLYGLAVIICVAYYASIGRITLVEAVAVGSAGGTYDVATSRLENYSGSTYFYPGYVNQFKNAILPVLTAAIIHAMWLRRVPGRLISSLVLATVAFIMIAGTGQRGALVASLIVVATALILSGSLTRRQLAYFFAAAMGAFTFLTVLLQRRAQELDQAVNVVDRSKIYFDAFWSRVVLENPLSGLAAFYVTEQDGTVWGAQWTNELVDLAPGQGSRSLAHRVFEYLYGTDRGTAPESIWGGIYYNFGYVVGVAVVVLLACFYSRLGHRIFRVPDSSHPGTMSFLSLLALSGIAVSLGSWIAGSPATLLNSGVLAYAGLYVIDKSGLLASRSTPSEGKECNNESLNLVRGSQRRTVPAGDDCFSAAPVTRGLGTSDSERSLDRFDGGYSQGGATRRCEDR